jgi:F0F1-type ATP synthase membrane subunit a
LILAPLIAAVEFISYFSRIFSLSIRLFANMMAGHTLLKILIGFSWVMLNSQAALILFSALP